MASSGWQHQQQTDPERGQRETSREAACGEVMRRAAKADAV
jgi:hypothetical protein